VKTFLKAFGGIFAVVAPLLSLEKQCPNVVLAIPSEKWKHHRGSCLSSSSVRPTMMGSLWPRGIKLRRSRSSREKLNLHKDPDTPLAGPCSDIWARGADHAAHRPRRDDTSPRLIIFFLMSHPLGIYSTGWGNVGEIRSDGKVPRLRVAR